MKIVIPFIGGDESITFSNDRLDNDDFINLLIGKCEYTVSIDEILSALFAFDEEKRRRAEREKHYLQ